MFENRIKKYVGERNKQVFEVGRVVQNYGCDSYYVIILRKKTYIIFLQRPIIYPSFYLILISSKMNDK